MLYDFFKDGHELDFKSVSISRTSPYKVFSALVRDFKDFEVKIKNFSDENENELLEIWDDLLIRFSEILPALILDIIPDDNDRKYFEDNCRFGPDNAFKIILALTSLANGQTPPEIGGEQNG